MPALEGALHPAGDNDDDDDDPEPSADEGGEQMPPALAEDIAAIPPPVLFGDDEKFVQTDAEADATMVPVGKPPCEQPSWLVGIPSSYSFTGGAKLEDAFRGLTPVQIAMRLKYGQDHIRSTVTVESYLSLRRRGAEHLSRPLEGTLAPKVVMSEALLEELGGADGQLSIEILEIIQSTQEPHVLIEPDAGVLMPPMGEKEERSPPMDFFKVVLKQPSRLQGQPRDQGTTLCINEIVVVKQPFLFVDRGRGDVFIFSDPSERRTDIQLLTTGDGLIARLQKWEADKEKYYWNESLKPQEHLRRQAISMIKTLMEAGAIETKGAPLNVSESDKESTAVLKELERLRVVVNCGSGGNVSSWLITARSANTLVPITRIHTPRFAINSRSETSEHSLISLGGHLERDGWRHEVREDK